MTEQETEEKQEKMTEEAQEEEAKIIEGIIIEADFGFNIKYKDLERLYLKLIIQQFDGFLSTQLFRVDKVGKLLQQFKGDFHGELSVKTLLHQRIYLLESERTNSVCDAIAKLPPTKYPQYQWIYNDNWD